MIRKINLIHHKYKHNIKDFTEVSITDIDSMPNFSIDILYCSCLNKIEKSKTQTYLDKILKKIRYGGQLVLVITDIVSVCQQYIGRSLSDEQFFEIMQDCHQTVTKDFILKSILDSNKYDLIGLEEYQNMIALSFGRNNND